MKEFAPNCFAFREDPCSKGEIKTTDRLVSPESVLIFLISNKKTKDAKLPAQTGLGFHSLVYNSVDFGKDRITLENLLVS